MSSSFQNRLVGTIVIVALAVLFLPDLLDGEKQTSEERFVSIPPRPQSQPMQDAPAFPKEQVTQATSRKVEIVQATEQDDELVLTAQDTEQTNPIPEQAGEQNPQTDTSSADEDANTVDDSDAEKLAKLAALAKQQDQISSGWVVQLGVFRHQANVKQLLKQLEASNYRAFSRKINTTNGELTKVFVGPDLDKSKLEKALPHLKELTGLSGKVSRFSVEQ